MVFFNENEQRTEKSPDYRIVMVTDDDKTPRPAAQSTEDDFMDGVDVPAQEEAVIDVGDIAF